MRYKFRAWDNVADEMLYAGEDTDVIFVLGSAGIECTDVRNGSPSGDGIDSMEHLIYMQWTGLTDRNGKEIYEGDIVQSTLTSRQIGKVIFENGIYKVLWSAEEYDSFLHNVIRSSEIIGNIYENPELINS